MINTVLKLFTNLVAILKLKIQVLSLDLKMEPLHQKVPLQVKTKIPHRNHLVKKLHQKIKLQLLVQRMEEEECLKKEMTKATVAMLMV